MLCFHRESSLLILGHAPVVLFKQIQPLKTQQKQIKTHQILFTEAVELLELLRH